MVLRNFFSAEHVLHMLISAYPIKRVARFINRYGSPRKPKAVKVGPYTMYGRTIDRILALYLWKAGILEGFEAKLMRDAVKKGMTVVDVGANIGYYTLIFADRVGKKGKVLSFEPDSENFSLLKKSIGINGFQNVEAFKQAVTNKNGSIFLYVCEEHRGDHRIYNPGDGRKGVKVEATTLDRALSSSKKVDIVKIDTDGAEQLVLEGMKEVVKRNKKIIIVCEFAPATLLKGGFSPKKFLETIEEYGLKLGYIDEKKERVEITTKENLLKKCTGHNYLSLYLTKK